MHKFALGPGNGAIAGTGQELAAGQVQALGTPLPGAVFTATQVAGVDLTTPEGWTIANSLNPQSASQRHYYVREITPPPGFNLPQSNPVQTVVVPGPTSVTAPVQNYVEFNHTQVSAANFLLPLTGGDGAVWFGLGGGALVAIALGAAVVVARRRVATERVTA